MKYFASIRNILLAVGATALPFTASAQTVLEGPGYPSYPKGKHEITTSPVAGQVHILNTGGGNVGALAGADGVLLVDDGYDILGPDVIAAVQGISDRPVKFVINTHFHGDHTGANGRFAANGTPVVAHDNVRRTLEQVHSIEAIKSRFAAYPSEALPIITFNDRMTFYLNGEQVSVVHVPNAHTDGDTVIYFEGSDVVATGDVFQRMGYPVFDRSNNGTFLGLLNAWAAILEMIGPQTKILPGHGLVATRADLQAAYDNMTAVRNRIAAAIAEGKTRAEAIAGKPTSGFDGDWPPKPMTPDLIAGWAYDELAQ